MTNTPYASFAPDAIKEGGSNLWDNVDATITAFRFTREMPDNYRIPPRDEEIDPIGAQITFEVVGNAPVEERRVSQFFSLGAKVGFAYDIARNGYGLVPKSPDAQLYVSNFTKFVRSLVENGLPAPVAATGDFSKILGLVGHFKRIEDKTLQQRTRTFKTKDGTERSVTEYPKILLCTRVLTLPNESSTARSGNTGNTPHNASNTPEDDTFDLDSAASEFLVAALKAKKKPIQRSQIVLLVSQQLAASNNPNPAVIAKRAAEEELLTSLHELGIVVYDAAAKGQPVTLPEAA